MLTLLHFQYFSLLFNGNFWFEKMLIYDMYTLERGGGLKQCMFFTYLNTLTFWDGHKTIYIYNNNL